MVSIQNKIIFAGAVGMDVMLHLAGPQRLPIIVLAGAGHFFHERLTQLKQIVLQHMGTQI